MTSQHILRKLCSFGSGNSTQVIWVTRILVMRGMCWSFTGLIFSLCDTCSYFQCRNLVGRKERIPLLFPNALPFRAFLFLTSRWRKQRGFLNSSVSDLGLIPDSTHLSPESMTGISHSRQPNTESVDYRRKNRLEAVLTYASFKSDQL